MAGAIAFSATGNSGQATYSNVAPAVAAEQATPATSAPATTAAGATAAAATASATGIATPAATASVAATNPATPTLVPAASIAPTPGEALPATPPPYTPAPSAPSAPPAAPAADAALELAAEIESKWGVGIVIAGQDWGADEAMRLRNLSALASALASLPANTVSLATYNSHGSLSVLSNQAGRTLAGWQPYGGGAANFYTTEDRDGDVRSVASQIVLQTGADRVTIAHELLHAYQMRDVPSGSYGQVLLAAEMRSFMAATGWVLTVSEEEFENRAHGSWDEIAAMFRYDGDDLSYVSATGETLQAYAPNPVEAFTAIGALIYAAPGGTGLPDWTEYERWFESNLS